MKRLIALLPALALTACGQPIVKDGDLKHELTDLGYTKVIIQPGLLNCGTYGRGKNFLGTNSAGGVIQGRICYRRTGDKTRPIDWDIRTNRVISGHAGYGWKNPALSGNF